MNGLIRKIIGSRKRRPQSGGGGSSADILRTRGRGSSDLDILHFLAQKTSDFPKFMVCPYGQGGKGLNQCGHFTDKEGGGEFFPILCGRLLWTVRYPKIIHKYWSFRDEITKQDGILYKGQTVITPHSFSDT